MYRSCILFLFVIHSCFYFSQNSCQSPKFVCQPTTTFAVNPAVSGTFQTGTYLGCLGSLPHPTFAFFHVGNSGSIQMQLGPNGASADVDFLCWGPFNLNTLQAICNNLTIANYQSCSYSASATETLTIPNALAGEFYMVMLSGGASTVNVTVIPAGTTGSLDCNLLPAGALPDCSTNTSTISALNLANLSGATYSLNPGGLTSGTPNFTVSPSVTTTYTVYATGTNSQSSTQTLSSTLTAMPMPTLSVSSNTSVVCSGQLFTLTASGAATYTWNGGSSTYNGSVVTTWATSSTVYTVNATAANGCSITATRSITINPLPVITASAGSTSVCPSHTVSLSAQGGLNYTWNTGSTTVTGSAITVSPAVTTQYTVTGNNSNNCQSSTTINITVYPLPVLAVSHTPNPVCEGMVAQLLASGALTYTWNTGSGSVQSPSLTFPATVSSQYTLAGTDAHGCSSSTVVGLQVSPTPSITINSSSAVACLSASVQLSVSGNGTYTWTANGIAAASHNSFLMVSPSVTTTYIAMETYSNGCQVSASINLPVMLPPSVSAASNSSTICAQEQATLTANGASTYSWTGSAVQAASLTVSPTVTTSYTVSGADANGCTNTCVVTQYVDLCTGIAALTGETAVKIYPNPNNGCFTIEGAGGAHIQVTDTLGRVIIDVRPEEDLILNIQDQANGIYSILLFKNNSFSAYKLLKQ